MKSPRNKVRRRQQRGFALLVVFLFAALVSFSLYQQLPRAAFESVRDKEQLLIDRGNEYKRAIEVFYAVNRRYPAELEDLEKSADRRYLRRRYVDPMTGKNEWRIIHTNGTFLTDSLVQKPPAQNAANGIPGVQVTTAGPLGANSMNTATATMGTDLASGVGASVDGSAQVQAVNPAVLRRPSDRLSTMVGGPPQNPDNEAEPAPFDPNAPSSVGLSAQGQQNPQMNPFGGDPQQMLPGAVNVSGSGIPGSFNPLGNPAQPGQTLQPGQGLSPQAAFAAAFGQQPQGLQPQESSPSALPGFSSTTGIPGQASGQGGFNPQPAFTPNPTGQNSNLVSVGPGAQLIPFGGQNSGQTGGGVPGRSGAAFPPPQFQSQPFPGQSFPGQSFPGQTSPGPIQARQGGGANTPLGTIGQQLRTPTPFQSGQNPLPAGGNLGSPGIAGVASKFEGPTIKTFRERTKYQEWEFVFDPQTALTNQQNMPQTNGQPLNPLQPNQPSPQQGPGSGTQNLFGPPAQRPNTPSSQQNSLPIFR